MSILERAIGYLSPETAAKREEARAKAEQFRAKANAYRKAGESLSQRGYEAAARSRRNAGWLTKDSGANAETRGALSIIRARSRDLVRNNGYARRGIGSIVANTVGTGIIARVEGRSAGAQKKLREAWKTWAESTHCDADGLHDFYGLQSLAFRAMVEGGECLIVRHRLNAAESRLEDGGFRAPIELQVLEGDFIDSSIERESGSTRVIQGVEFDAKGRRTAYYLFPKHPGNGNPGSSRRVPAEDVIHLFNVERAGQVRGVPWAAPIVVPTRDLDEYEDAELVRRKVAACFAGFVIEQERPETPTGPAPALSEKIEPGILEVLPAGKDIRFNTPPSVTGYGEYSTAMLRKVASGLELPYEELTGDYSQVNFSSGRMGWLGFQRNIDRWQWHVLVPRLCVRVWEWWKEAAAITGVRTEGAIATWTPPRREMIDPVKETAATISQIRGGLMTRAEAIRRQGYDPTEVYEEYKSDNDAADKHGLVFDSDPRKTVANGKLQDAGGDSPPDGANAAPGGEDAE